MWDCSGEITRLVELDERGNLTLTGMADEIEEKGKTINPVLVVLDPIVSFGPSESRINDSEQMLILAARRIVRGLDCCVRYVTHVSQNNTQRGGPLSVRIQRRNGTGHGSLMVAVLQPWNPTKQTESPPLTLDRNLLDQVFMLARPKLSYVGKQ